MISSSVRLDTESDLTQVAMRVGQALDCTFVEGEFQRWYAQVANVLGLKISVSGVDTGGKKVVRLIGAVAEERFLYAPDGSDDVEFDRVDISAYVVDLLTIRTGHALPIMRVRTAATSSAPGWDRGGPCADFLSSPSTRSAGPRRWACAAPMSFW